MKPIPRRNLHIFRFHGPGQASVDGEVTNSMWKNFESEIISNNQRLVELLSANVKLFHSENQEIISEFMAHVEEFIHTRENNNDIRNHLFPPEMNSIFGIEKVNTKPAPNVSALQNFVKLLIRQSRFILLEFTPNPTIEYFEAGDKVILNLSDRPRVQQIYWANKCFRNVGTNLRIENLVWILNWLERNRIHYEFDLSDITKFHLNDRYVVIFVYEYIVSQATLARIPFEKGQIVVNLHNWNGAPFTTEAHEYAGEMGVETMTQNEFHRFCHRKVK